jgi:hypothetical protein
MSYQEKNATIAMLSHLLIGGYYCVSLAQILKQGEWVSSSVFALWAVVIIAIILVNIFASVLIYIGLAILYAIRNKTDKPERHSADERDALIELKGTKAAYITLSIGVFLALIAFVLAQPPLAVFSLIVFFSIAAQVIGDMFQIYLYRRGF